MAGRLVRTNSLAIPTPSLFRLPPSCSIQFRLGVHSHGGILEATPLHSAQWPSHVRYQTSARNTGLEPMQTKTKKPWHPPLVRSRTLAFPHRCLFRLKPSGSVQFRSDQQSHGSHKAAEDPSEWKLRKWNQEESTDGPMLARRLFRSGAGAGRAGGLTSTATGASIDPDRCCPNTRWSNQSSRRNCARTRRLPARMSREAV